MVCVRVDLLALQILFVAAAVTSSHVACPVHVHTISNFQSSLFCCRGPSTWNSLPDSLHDPALSLNMFRRQLKTYLYFLAKY